MVTWSRDCASEQRTQPRVEAREMLMGGGGLVDWLATPKKPSCTLLFGGGNRPGAEVLGLLPPWKQ